MITISGRYAKRSYAVENSKIIHLNLPVDGMIDIVHVTPSTLVLRQLLKIGDTVEL